ncbi:MAG TPA: N-acetyl-gamma-glutamyl-phosphate reductase [Vicinamibacterales bacterium]|nr:N-acetyl-gamma-glutamyl-phosphate reductase [Vicinamibacterales bacterium]
MKLDVVILGASGYGGGELLRLLSGHPSVARLRGTSRQHAGRPWHACHPNLRGVLDGGFEGSIDWGAYSAAEHPVVFSAMPHGQLAGRIDALEAEWSAAGIGERVTLVDLSGDFRLRTPGEFAAAYGGAHPCPERLGTFVYGLPEWTRPEIPGARRVAAAGCFATALQLALLPLRGLDVGFLAATAVTGSSGSGASPAEATHHPTRAHDVRAYKVLCHQHLSEVQATMARGRVGGRISFVPASAPLVRGIFASVQFALPSGLDAAALRERAEGATALEPFVRLVEGSPRVLAVAGSNFADLAVTARDGHAAILVAIDNLGKGMAGQAVQCLNAALGLPETTGLRCAAPYPA